MIPAACALRSALALKLYATVLLTRRAHLPIIVASGLLDRPVRVPWWGGASLRLSGG